MIWEWWSSGDDEKSECEGKEEMPLGCHVRSVLAINHFLGPCLVLTYRYPPGHPTNLSKSRTLHGPAWLAIRDASPSHFSRVSSSLRLPFSFPPPSPAYDT